MKLVGAAALLFASVALAACGGAAAAGHSPPPSTRLAASGSSSSVTTTTVAHRSTTTTTTPPTTTTTTTVLPTTSLPPAPTTTVPSYSTTPTVPGPPPPPLAQPTAAHPLTILEIGDSLGEDLGLGMADVLGSDALVRVVQAAVGDSGLARPDFYDWPAHLASELSVYHPGAVVVMLGGDDGQNFVDNGELVTFGSAQWHTVYSERVANLMNEATQAGAHVFWVGMPIMGDPGLSSEMSLENQVYAQQAAIHPGVTYFSSWSLFANSAGQYAQYLPNSSGQMVMMRDVDGVHLTGAGSDRLANAIVEPMQQAFGVTLKS